jgi:hypothetical protein
VRVGRVHESPRPSGGARGLTAAQLNRRQPASSTRLLRQLDQCGLDAPHVQLAHAAGAAPVAGLDLCAGRWRCVAISCQAAPPRPHGPLVAPGPRTSPPTRGSPARPHRRVAAEVEVAAVLADGADDVGQHHRGAGVLLWGGAGRQALSRQAGASVQPSARPRRQHPGRVRAPDQPGLHVGERGLPRSSAAAP